MIMIRNTGLIHIQFSNKLTLSIFTGTGSCSENKYKVKSLEQLYVPKNKKILYDKEETKKSWEIFDYISNDCEIAILNDKGEFVTGDFSNDEGELATENFFNYSGDVDGYVPIYLLIETMCKIKNFKKYDSLLDFFKK